MHGLKSIAKKERTALNDESVICNVGGQRFLMARRSYKQE